MKVTSLRCPHAPEKLPQNALSDCPLTRAGRRVVEHPDLARRAARLHAVRGIPRKPRCRSENPDDTPGETGRGGFPREAPVQRASPALRVRPDAARPRLPPRAA